MEYPHLAMLPQLGWPLGVPWGAAHFRHFFSMILASLLGHFGEGHVGVIFGVIFGDLEARFVEKKPRALDLEAQFVEKKPRARGCFLAALGSCWQLLAAPGCSLQFFVAPGRSWQLSWQLIAAHGICQYI